MASVNFVNEGKMLDALPGTNLRDVALRSGIQLDSPVRRVFHVNVKFGPLKLFSGSDVVQIDGKGVNSRSEEEEKALGGRLLKRFKISPAERLASQVVVTGDIVVRTRVNREVDKKQTREQVGYAALMTGFAALMLFMFALVGLDLIKRM